MRKSIAIVVRWWQLPVQCTVRWQSCASLITTLASTVHAGGFLLLFYNKKPPGPCTSSAYVDKNRKVRCWHWHGWLNEVRTWHRFSVTRGYKIRSKRLLTVLRLYRIILVLCTVGGQHFKAPRGFEAPGLCMSQFCQALIQSKVWGNNETHGFSMSQFWWFWASLDLHTRLRGRALKVHQQVI